MQSEEAPARSVSPFRFGLTPPPPSNEINVRHFHHCQHRGQLDFYIIIINIIFILSFDKATLKRKTEICDKTMDFGVVFYLYSLTSTLS